MFSSVWELDLLGNLVQIKSGYSPSKYELDKSGEMPFLKVEELNNCDKYQEYSRFYTERNSDAVPSKSVVFPKRGAAILNNKVRILRVDALLDSNLMALIPQHSLDAEFLYYLINKIELYKIADTSTIPQINNKHIEPYSIYLPSTEEQIKIASFLSNVDEKISQLTQKHQLLSQYKQGMMQKLFSQQIRFKADDGSEFGEWEETSLHTFLCESLIKGSKGNKAKKLTVKLWGKGVIPKNEAFQGSENTQYYKRSAGQLIYGKLDFLNCDFGLIPEYLDGFESTIDAPAFDIDNKIVHPYFLINRFLQKDFYQKNGEEADGSRKAKRINQSVFLAMQIGLPSLEEQTKIANFLSAIDQKIEVMAQQIEQAKTWKKGLLQQMFV
nr:restriction endonuclease subunit S [Acinetobacter sp. YH12200]